MMRYLHHNRLIRLAFLILGGFPLLAQGTGLRIVGGQPAAPSAWPWLAALVYRSPEDSLLENQFCTGSLIHPRWLLTAAHCVFDSHWSIPLTADKIDVVLGIVNLRTDKGERVHVKKIVIHPDYTLELNSPDLALLELATAVNHPTIGLASQVPPEGSLATVMGWGDTSTISRRPLFVDELQQISVPIVPNQLCQTALEQELASELLTAELPTMDHLICAGVAGGGQDTCYGDSGSPLIVDQGDGWKQIGIVTGGTSAECAKPNNYGIYTKVSDFFEFIGENLCDRKNPSELLFTNPIPPAPVLALNVTGRHVTVAWKEIPEATGYQIFYAPYPAGRPVGSFEVNQMTNYSVDLAPGQNYYVALRAYHGICYGDFSNVGFFVLP